MRDDSRLAGALRLLARKVRLRPDAGWHPTPEELTAYRFDRLSSRQTGRTQEHLAFCPQCSEQLLDLELFLAEPETDPGDASASWRELQPWLADEPTRPRFWRRILSALAPRFPYSLAAALLVVSAGLGSWNLSLRRALDRPQANVTIQELALPGTQRGPGKKTLTLRLPPGAERIVLVIRPAELPEAPEYRLEILAGERRAAFVPGLRKSESGALHVSLPRKDLPQGELRLRLAAIGSGGTENTEDVQVSVSYP